MFNLLLILMVNTPQNLVTNFLTVLFLAKSLKKFLRNINGTSAWGGRHKR